MTAAGAQGDECRRDHDLSDRLHCNSPLEKVFVTESRSISQWDELIATIE